MAGNFKGLTIEITGDATQLESVLLSIKRTSRSVQSEVEAVGKAMKLDPTNTALAAKYYDSMADKLTLTQKRAEAMRQEQDRLNEKLREYHQTITGLPAGSEAYQAVEQKIAETEAEQQRLTTKLEEYKQKLETLRGDAESYERIRKAIGDAEKKQLDLSEKIALYKTELQGLEKGSEAYKKVERQLKNAQNSQQVLTDRLKNYKNELKKLSGNAVEYQRIKTEIERVEKEQLDLTKKLEEYKTKLNGLEKGSKAFTDMQRQIEKTEYKLRDLNTQILTTDTDIKQLQSTMRLLDIKNATTGLAGWGNDLVNQGRSMQAIGDAMVSVTDAYTKFVGLAAIIGAPRLIRSVEEYGNVVAQIGGYLDITGDKLESMSELALYTGKETIYSATEAGQAISNLAKGGMTEAQIKAGALEATVSLAAAGQLDLADAAKVTAQAIAAFQLDAEDAVTVADALAGAATNSVASVSSLSTGFTQAASWARAAGWTINDVAGALALLTDYGLEAEMGGTALRNVLLRLAAPTDAAAAAMEEYGIEVRDADGHMKSAVEVVQNLSDAMAGMNDEERDALVKTVFGTRGANAALALVDAGADKLQEYIGYTEDTGAAARMAQAQMGELGWALEYLRGEAETAAVNFGEALTPTLVSLAKAAENMLTQFNGMSKAEREAAAKSLLFKASLPIIINLFGRMYSGIGKLSVGLGEVMLGFTGYRRAIAGGTDVTRAVADAFAAAAGATETTADHMKKASELTAGLGSALTGLKAILIGGGVIAVIALIASEIQKTAEAERKAKEHADKLEAATDGLRRTVRLTSPSIEHAGRTFEYYHRTAEEAAKSSDEVLDSYLELGETIKDNNEQAQAQIDKLATVKSIMQDYANSDVPLTEKQLGELTWAVKEFNSEFGTNYEIIDKERGIIGLEGEAVENLTTDFYELIDARMKYAEAEAIAANMTETMQQQSKTRAEISKTKDELEAAYKDLEYYEEEYQRAQHRLENTSPRSEEWWEAADARDRAMAQYEDARKRVEALTTSLTELEEAYRNGDISLEEYKEQLGELYSSAETTAEKVELLKNAVGDELFGNLGDRTEEFITRLEEAGVSSEQFTSMTQEQWAALVTALNADGYMMEDMLALVTGNLSLASDDWRSIIEQWAADNGVTTEEAMAALSEGIKNGDIDVSNGLQGILDSGKDVIQTFANEDAPDAGEGVGSGVADGVGHSEQDMRNAANRLLDAFKETIENGNTFGSGIEMATVFANGMTSQSALGAVAAASARIAAVAKESIHFSIPDKGPLRHTEEWGRELTLTYARGIMSGIRYIDDAFSTISNQMPDDQSFYMSAGGWQSQTTVINIDGMRVNDDIGIRQNVLDFAYALKAKERGYVG